MRFIGVFNVSCIDLPGSMNGFINDTDFIDLSLTEQR